MPKEIIPKLRSVEEAQARIIDDAALKIRIIIVRFKHEKLGSTGSIHWVTSLWREGEALLEQSANGDNEYKSDCDCIVKIPTWPES